MPTYQYRCADCGEEREVVQSFTEDALTECPVCEGRFRKVFSAVGVVFKGSGFYRTDSRSSASSGNGSSKNGSDSSSSESSATSSGSDSKSSGESSGKSDSGTDSKNSGSGTKDSGSTAKQPSAA